MVEAAARLERAELRPLGRDPQVAGQGKLEPAGEGPPVHRGDHRLRDLVQAPGQAAQAEVDDFAHPLWRRLDVVLRNVGAQVGARAEGVAGAAKDGYVEVLVVAEVGPDLAQGRVHRRVDRVLRLRAVERDRGDPVPLLIEDRIGHGSRQHRLPA
jgi:hypothetical protein